MDSQVTTFSFADHNETDNIATVHAPHVAEEGKKSTTVMLEEDRVNQMTLNIGTVPDTIQSQNTKVVTQQPRATLRMKPENYVIGLEHLQEAPEYIDCPYCKSRQKTKVRHESTSQTALAAAVCCLFCGIIPVVIPFLCNWCADTDHYCEACHKRVAHKPHEGKMEAVLPPVSPKTPGVDARYQLSQFADMSVQSRQKLEPGVV